MKSLDTVVLVGAQYGDEGKGKIVDILSQNADMVVRPQGGNNAGHTIVKDDKTYKLHLIPSGILYPNCQCIIGCGTVINPKAILQEMQSLQDLGISLDQLKIDCRAHVTMPYHIIQDGLHEQSLVNNIGTTKKGIGPTYMDKSNRIGLRMCDLVDTDTFAKKIRQIIDFKNKYIGRLYDSSEKIDADQVIQEYTEYGKQLRQYVIDTTIPLYQSIKQGKRVLFEGAQGTLLDIDIGTYPYVTSSHPVAGGACVGAGIGPTLISQVIGVAKAYTTRVGSGPFVTELHDDIGRHIQTIGCEIGTTTGRTRRVGWLDCIILRYAVRVNGCTSIAINKLDTLTGIKTLKIATSYRYKDRELTEFVADVRDLSDCTPVYIEMPGWEQDISQCKSFEQLPKQAQDYINMIQKLIDCPISMIGVGPDREQNIYR
ncbi:MAG: adenylosuccinate synthase [Clostridiales bacterium]|jgi:adenylosuccinate synthase|nr:adenylosuccinate synthase [Clostridiales bacterium]